MTYIIYNKADPSMPEVDCEPYVVFRNSLEEAEENFDWASEDLSPGEAMFLVKVDLERGKLSEEVVKAGLQNDWKEHVVTVHKSISNFFTDEAEQEEEWEDD